MRKVAINVAAGCIGVITVASIMALCALPFLLVIWLVTHTFGGR